MEMIIIKNKNNNLKHNYNHLISLQSSKTKYLITIETGFWISNLIKNMNNQISRASNTVIIIPLSSKRQTNKLFIKTFQIG